MNNIEKVKKLRQMHVGEKALLIFHIWSMESGKEIQKYSPIVATGSYAMSEYYGYEDGENMPWMEIVNHVKVLIKEDNIVMVDIESGYAKSSEELENNIKMLLEIGVSGINIEDKISGKNELYSIAEQVERIKIVRKIAREEDRDFFINVRTDMYFVEGVIDADINDLPRINETINRIQAYENAGADCIFIPGLKNIDLIKLFANKINIPFDIMLDFVHDDLSKYTKIGVSRICSGPSLYLAMKENQSVSSFFDEYFSNSLICLDN